MGSVKLSDLIRPPTQSGFNKKLEDHKESIYQSKKDKPLGKSRKDLLRHVPDNFDKTNVFGITTEYDGTVAECVNPDKTQKQISEKDEKAPRQLRHYTP